MAVSVPKELATRTAEGETVLFVGAGMSQPELPGWSGLLKEMLKWARGESIQLDFDSIEELIAENDLLLAAARHGDVQTAGPAPARSRTGRRQ